MNQCWFLLGGEASGEAALSGEARAEISRDLDELFSREFDVGEPEEPQVRGMGRIWIVQGPPGKMFYMSMIFMLTFYLTPSQRTRNKRATILAHPQIHLSLLA